MPAAADSPTATDRIAAAFDPANLRRLTDELAVVLSDHLARVQGRSTRVLNWHKPLENIRTARQELAKGDVHGRGPIDPDDLARRFRELAELCLARGNNLHHPRYIGHQVPAPIPLAGLFDALGGITNQVMAIYEMGPFATAVEHALIESLGAALGFDPRTSGGLVTSGGSLANLTGLAAARNVALAGVWQTGLAAPVVGPSWSHSANHPPVLVAHADAHYSVARAAGILGLGTNQIVPVRLDRERRMDPNHLDDLLAELRGCNVPIVAVTACACATPIGAFDPLPEIAEVCRRHEVWLHVDAAHGGAAALSDRYRQLVAGLNQADSVVCDAHKMLFVPALCAFLFYRDRKRRFAAFEQTAPYLFDPSAPGMAEYDSGLVTIECTKRAAAFGLWGVWSMFGRQLFADLVDRTFDLGRAFYELLQATDDFEPLHEPQCNIVAFRYVPPSTGVPRPESSKGVRRITTPSTPPSTGVARPESSKGVRRITTPSTADAPGRATQPETIDDFPLRLRRSLIESGDFYIVPCRIDGESALRVTIINPLTTKDDLTELLSALRRQAAELRAATG